MRVSKGNRQIPAPSKNTRHSESVSIIVAGQHKVVESEQVVDFMPPQAVTFAWSWWAGMSPGMFVVAEHVASSASAAHAPPPEETQPSR